MAANYKAVPHLKNLLKMVSCQVCSKALLTPLTAPCGHIACANCFLPPDTCPMCSFDIPNNKLRPNQSVALRTSSVLKLVRAFEALTGVQVVVTSPSSGTDKLIESDTDDDSDEWFFKKDKKFAKKYEKRERDSLNDVNKLQSVSQNDTPLIFPGEVIHDSKTYNDSSIVDKNMDAKTKVRNWLATAKPDQSTEDPDISSSINVANKSVCGSSKNVQPVTLYEDFFSTKIKTVLSSTMQPVVHLTNASFESSGKISGSKALVPKTPLNETLNSTKHSSSDSKSKGAKDSPQKSLKSNLSSDKGCRRSTRNLKLKITTSKQSSPAKSLHSFSDTTLSPIKPQINTRNRKKMLIDDSEDTSFKENTSLNRNENDTMKENVTDENKEDSLLKRFFSTAINKTNKDENSTWKNVKKMKKVFRKPTRPALKKLDISIEQHTIPISSITVSDKSFGESPVVIEDVVTQSLTSTKRNHKHGSPEHVRRHPNTTVIDSSVLQINLDSPDMSTPKVSKDFLALQEVLKQSAEQEMCRQGDVNVTVSSDMLDNKDCSELPLTHFSPVSKSDVSKINRINRNLKKKEVIIEGILKDFEVDGSDVDDTDKSSHTVPMEVESKDVEVVEKIDLSNNNSSLQCEVIPETVPQGGMETKHVSPNNSFGMISFDNVKVPPNNSMFTAANSIPNIQIAPNNTFPAANSVSHIKITPNIALFPATNPVSNIKIAPVNAIFSTTNPVSNINRSDIKKSTVPFIYRSRLKHRTIAANVRRVPFYYKTKCTSRNWNRTPQDGLNIQINSDNVLTTIAIRNQPLSTVRRDTSNLKIVNVRDAQTSPIHFLEHSSKLVQINPSQKPSLNTDSENPLVHGSSHTKTHEVQRNDSQFKITESLEQELNKNYTNNCVVVNEPELIKRTPSAILQKSLKSIKQTTPNVPSERRVPIVSGTSTLPLMSDDIPLIKTQNLSSSKKQISDKSVKNTQPTNRTETLSPPLEVFEPDDLMLTEKFNKKRKSFSDVYDNTTVAELNYKKTKTMELCSNKNLIISFESQSQSDAPSVQQNKCESDSEALNYDALVGNVFANIDDDLRITTKYGDSQKSNKATEITSSNNGQSYSLVGRSQSQIPQPPVNLENISSQTNRDKTDLRNLSMELEPDIKYSENMSMFDRNTVCYSDDFSRNKEKVDLVTQVPISLPGTIQQLKDENSRLRALGGSDPSKSRNEKTIELSPEDQLLLTPTANVRNEPPVENMLSQEVFTPQFNKTDSDSSMVEDTPQKPRKITILKRSTSDRKLRTSGPSITSVDNYNPVQTPRVESPQNDITNLQCPKSSQTKETLTKKFETPLNITRFSSDVRYQSTPVQVLAKRSLIYSDALSKISEDDDEVAELNAEGLSTSRQSLSYTKTGMEREFLEQAFDSSSNETIKAVSEKSGRNSTIIGLTGLPSTVPKMIKTKDESMPTQRKQTVPIADRDICLACSCLSSSDTKKVMELVNKMGWKFTKQYVDDLTHLVVKVDEQNRAQRSVKYLQGVAAGKWIVSFTWIEACLKMSKHVPEEEFEALDTFGEMGPMMSRTSETKLFSGFTLYCLPPFSIISPHVLESMLSSAGAHVVDKIEDGMVKESKKISIVLAEPSNTEDTRFIDLAMRHPVVLVNFEWVIESLGQWYLHAPGNYLLTPRTMLPSVDWPISLASDESMEM